MQVYVYAILNQEGQPTGETIELLHGMTEPARTIDPVRGRPIRRVPAVTALPRIWSESATRENLSDHNLGSLGFTKYVKTSDGGYEKTVGDGPNFLNQPGGT